MRAYHHSELRSYNDALADLDETVNVRTDVRFYCC